MLAARLATGVDSLYALLLSPQSSALSPRSGYYLACSWSPRFRLLAEYPERPIRFIIPSAAGGSPDVLMRILTAELSKRLGVSFVVINKPGANAVIGTMEIVSAAPDGYTLGYGNIVSLAIVYGLMSSVPYKVEDLTLIANCLRVSNMLAVNNDLPVRSVQRTDRLLEEKSGQAGHGVPAAMARPAISAASCSRP